jgi:tRNA-specific 2-thiouridylase
MLDDKTIAMVRKALDLPGNPADHRVVVAMSGGVDSSVAAGLVKQAGFETIGITLQLYDHGAAIARKGACCAGQDIHDARRVAEHLGIAHYVLDYESRFADSVISDFVNSYLVGETPVPCITCNQSVKFSDLLAQTRDLGADVLVTGHYVESRARDNNKQHFDMLTPFDMARDQSYFLFATTQDQLDFLRFPLAGFSKDNIRLIAEQLGLDIAAKPDSQDICFVPEGNYVDVIATHAPEALKDGKLVHVDGRQLGHHKGIVNFTIGQRKGIGIADKDPLYVTELDADTATVYVGPREALKKDLIRLKDLNWIADMPWNSFGEDREVFVKLRSTGKARSARLIKQGNHMAVQLKEADYGVSPGQACVIYEATGPGAKVLGGGFIASAHNANNQ